MGAKTQGAIVPALASACTRTRTPHRIRYQLSRFTSDTATVERPTAPGPTGLPRLTETRAEGVSNRVSLDWVVAAFTSPASAFRIAWQTTSRHVR